MTFTAAQLCKLSDEELLAVAYAEQDPLTSTPLELELVKRLATASDELDYHKPVTSVLDEFDDIAPADLRDLLERAPAKGGLKEAVQLLSVLAEEEVETAEALRAAFEIVGKLNELTIDPTQALDALETLFNTATA